MSSGALVRCPFNLPTSIFHGTLTCPRPRCSPAEAVTPVSGYPAALCRRYTAGPRREPEHDGPELERAFTRHLSARTASVRFAQMRLTTTQALSQHFPCWFPPKSSMVTGQWRNTTTGTCVVANVCHIARNTAWKGRKQRVAKEEEWNI